MAKTPKNNSKYLGDTIDNLIRWDMFHMVNENWSKRYKREDIIGESSILNLEASDLYVLHTADCTTNPGNKVLCCIVDPKDKAYKNNVLTAMISVHPKEPVLVKQRPSYEHGTLEMIHLLDAKKREATTEDAKKAIDSLIELVGGIIAKEHGLNIKKKKKEEEDGKDTPD